MRKTLCHLLLWAGLSILLCQACVMNSFGGLLWAWDQPGAFVLTLSILFATEVLVFSVVGSVRTTVAMVGGGYFLLGLISWVKRLHLGMPLFPWDFQTLTEVIQVFPALLRASPWLVWPVLGILAGVGFIARRLFLWVRATSEPFRWRRVALGFGGLSVLATLMLANNPLHDHLFGAVFPFVKQDPTLSYAQNGLLMNFVAMVEQGVIYAPRDYSPHAAQNLFKKYAHRPKGPLRQPASARPDVVVVMSESLFDPLELKGVVWKEDPLSFTRSLVHGRSLSAAMVPVFGGKTANSEFEFLTGHATRFLARGSVPYEKLIDSPHLSLVHTFAREGYRTIAIHPGNRNYWNREKVYQQFGFDHFYGSESFFPEDVLGNYSSDESILRVLGGSLAENSGPSFHFIVTMQNHMPYEPSPFVMKDPLFQPDSLAADERVILNYYSKLVRETDRFHQHLVHFLEERKRPTLLVIFGDHLPPLSSSFALFKGRMIHDIDPGHWSVPEVHSMYTTPLVIWSNFGLQDEAEPLEISFLGGRLLQKIGLHASPYQRFLADMSDHMRFIHPQLPSALDNEAEKKWRSDYRIFQYATLMNFVPMDEDEDLTDL